MDVDCGWKWVLCVVNIALSPEGHGAILLVGGVSYRVRVDVVEVPAVLLIAGDCRARE